jgi:hypothetical protein
MVQIFINKFADLAEHLSSSSDRICDDGRRVVFFNDGLFSYDPDILENVNNVMYKVCFIHKIIQSLFFYFFK